MTDPLPHSPYLDLPKRSIEEVEALRAVNRLRKEDDMRSPAARGSADASQRRSLQQERLAKGLCPNCGKDAAPYRLCGDCRLRSRIYSALNRGERLGGLRSEGAGRDRKYFLSATPEAWKGRAYGKNDRRFAPRLGNVPVDVERELIALMESMGRPATLDEIMAAWGKLRETRKTGSLTGDMRALIEAQRKRERKAAKRAALGSREVDWGPDVGCEIIESADATPKAEPRAEGEGI